MSKKVISPPPIVNDITETIGNTPIVNLKSLINKQKPNDLSSSKIEILAKLEYLNSLSGSIKDRVARKILIDAEASNKIKSGSTLLIPTSGNLGISIALLAQRKGYKTIALIPERTSIDRVNLLKTLGVEIIRTQNEVYESSSESNVNMAIKLSNEIANSFVIDEYASQSNLQTHYEETAEEIFLQVDGNLDVLVIGVESGASQEFPSILKVVAVEPQHSRIQENKPILPTSFKDRKVEDIGNNFTPNVLDRSLIDLWMKISDKDSFTMARKLIAEGFLAGSSSGAVVHAAILYAKNYMSKEKQTRILTILNDTARNYSSTLLSDEWLLENDLMDDETFKKLEYQKLEKFRAASVEDLQLPAALTISPNVKISRAIDLMIEREFSQLPVIDSHRKLIGYVSLASLQTHLNTPLSELSKFFEKHSFAVITDSERKFCLGITTKYDLIHFLNHRNSMF
nr:11121_t:CDS:10 [Entrophospora candida]